MLAAVIVAVYLPHHYYFFFIIVLTRGRAMQHTGACTYSFHLTTLLLT